MANSQSFSLEIDSATLANVQAVLIGVKNGASRVISRAVNKTLYGVRTDAVNEISKDITPTKTKIRKTFVVNKTTISSLKGKVFSVDKPHGLIHYQPRQTKKGVSVKVKRKGKRTLIPGAFIARVKNADNVFWREWHGPKRSPRTAWRSGGRSGGRYEATFPYSAMPKKYRFPIHRLTGPRFTDIFGNPKVMAEILKLANVRLDKNISNQLDYELSKL
jgi:hypothetical protein